MKVEKIKRFLRWALENNLMVCIERYDDDVIGRVEVVGKQQCYLMHGPPIPYDDIEWIGLQLD
jgi:hypothetical protein